MAPEDPGLEHDFMGEKDILILFCAFLAVVLLGILLPIFLLVG